MTSGWSGARSRRSGSAGYTEPAGSTLPLLPYGKFIKPRRDGVMGNVDGVRPTTLLLPRQRHPPVLNQTSAGQRVGQLPLRRREPYLPAKTA